MIKQLFNNLFSSHFFAGIELEIQSDGVYKYNISIIKKEKSKLVIEHSITDILSIEDLIKYIPASCPIQLVVNGRGVMHKKLDYQENLTDLSIVTQLLPNVQPDKFYIQKINSENQLFCSIIRKEVLDAILDDFNAAKLYVVSTCLGPFYLSILAYLDKSKYASSNGHSDIITFKKYLIETKETGITDFKEISLFDNYNAPENAIAYAAAICGFFPDHLPISINNPEVDLRKDEFNQKIIFNFLFPFALSFIFLVLLINFVVFSVAFNNNKELQSRQSSLSSEFELNKTIREDIDEKEKFLVQTGWIKPSRISFMADRVAHSIPKEVQLVSLDIIPFEPAKSIEHKSIVFDKETINIKGHTANAIYLNNWIKELEKLDWITSIAIKDYLYDHQDKKGNFTLELKLKP